MAQVIWLTPTVVTVLVWLAVAVDVDLLGRAAAEITGRVA